MTKINQANLASLISSLQAERWHFDMRHIFGRMISETQMVRVCSVHRDDCNTCACIDGTIKILSTDAKQVDDAPRFTTDTWLGVAPTTYGDIIMPKEYYELSQQAPEHIQRRAAIMMLQDLAAGKMPGANWFRDYIEIAEGELE